MRKPQPVARRRRVGNKIQPAHAGNQQFFGEIRLKKLICHASLFQISSLLAKYAQHLLDENKIIQAIELYRKANYFLEAARLLADLAKEETEKRSSPLRIKKLYVLSALLVEEHLKNVKKNAKGAGVRSSALIGLVDGDAGGGTGEMCKLSS